MKGAEYMCIVPRPDLALSEPEGCIIISIVWIQTKQVSLQSPTHQVIVTSGSEKNKTPILIWRGCKFVSLKPWSSISKPFSEKSFFHSYRNRMKIEENLFVLNDSKWVQKTNTNPLELSYFDWKIGWNKNMLDCVWLINNDSTVWFCCRTLLT